MVIEGDSSPRKKRSAKHVRKHRQDSQRKMEAPLMDDDCTDVLEKKNGLKCMRSLQKFANRL